MTAVVWRVAKIALPILLSIAVIAYIGRVIDWRETLANAMRAPWWALGGGIALIWMQLCLCGLRLRWLARSFDIPVSAPAASAVWSLSYLGGLVLPTSVGSEIVKGGVLLKWTRLPARILGVLALERVAATLALVLMVLVAAPFVAERAGFGHEGLIALACGLGVLAIVAGLMFRVRIASGLLPVLVALRAPQGAARWMSDALRDAPLGRCVALSLLIHALTFAVIGLLLAGAGAPAPILEAMIGGPLVTFAAMLPISLGGFGVREGAFMVVLGWFGVEASKAAGVGLTWWGVQALAGVSAAVVAAVWLLGGGRAGARSRGAPADEAVATSAH